MRLFLLLILASCASKPKLSLCPEVTEIVELRKKEVSQIQGNVSRFLSDAQITQEHSTDGKSSLWRFKNLPRDSVYYLLGLREGDAITKTNLGEHNSSTDLISDFSGIPSGTTNCLYVLSKHNSMRVIKIKLKKD